MIVLDSFAVLALLKGEPAADHVRDLLVLDECRLTVLGVAEVLDHLVRIVGIAEDEAVLDLAHDEQIEIIALPDSAGNTWSP